MLNNNKTKASIDKISGQKIKTDFLKNYITLIALVVLIVSSGILSKSFFLPQNIINIMGQLAYPGILAVGMHIAILSAGIDLSVGSIMATTSVIVAMLLPGCGVVVSIVTSLLFGIVVGSLYGLIIGYWNVPPFIITLAGLTMFRGVALYITGSSAVAITNSRFLFLGYGRIDSTIIYVILAIAAVYLILNTVIVKTNITIRKIITLIVSLACLGYLAYLVSVKNGLSIQIMILFIILLIAWFILEMTILGQHIYAIGGNKQVAQILGINAHRVTILVYLICSLLAALAGVLTSARLGSGTPQIGQAVEIDAIAAVIIGGTSFSGGSGKLSGTIIGFVLIGVLNNLLSLLGMQSTMQMIIKGIVIFVAVVFDTKINKGE